MAIQLDLAESTGALFSLKEVTWTPDTPKQKEPFTIKGKVDLINVPFLPLVWVIASVTYPKQLTDILGAPVAQSMSMAWFGNFSISFNEGFDREGEYKLDLNVYLGPTVTTSLAFITSKSVTIPPLPPSPACLRRPSPSLGRCHLSRSNIPSAHSPLHPRISTKGQRSLSACR